MKKIILSVITILIMTFGMITNVKAETCINQSYWNELQDQFTSTTTLTNDNNTIIKNFHNNTIINFGNYDTIKGQIWYAITDTSNTIYSNIGITNWNLELTCQRTETITSGGNTWGYITYQDGTTSTISSTLKGVVCDYYSGQIITQNNNATIQTNWKYEPNITRLSMSLVYENGNINPCITDNNGNFTCYIKNNDRYKGFRYEYTLSNSNTANIKYGITSGTIKKCQNDTTQIINNQNQNTTSINNNITNLNDNILNSNLDTNTSSNASNIGSNDIDSGSKNVILDFMLMPITFIQNLLNSFDSTCATLCIGNCSSGHDNDWRFVFPCIDLQSILGSTVYNLIDLLMTFGMVFAFVRSVVGFLKKALLLESDVSSEVRIF